MEVSLSAPFSSAHGHPPIRLAAVIYLLLSSTSVMSKARLLMTAHVRIEVTPSVKITASEESSCYESPIPA